MFGLFGWFSDGGPDVWLRGDRVYLRPPRWRDYPAWRGLREASRAFLTPWEPQWPDDALTRAAFRRRLHRAAVEWREDDGYAFHIFRREDDALVGGVGLSHVRRGVAQIASVGYWIGQPFARAGFMTDALGCVLDFAFRDLALHRVEAACLPANAASRALLTKWGFLEEGLARSYLRINGAWEDHLLFAQLREDRKG